MLPLLLLAGLSVELALCEQCYSSLGLETGVLSDAQLSASSSYEINSVGPLQARLNNNKGGGAWCPKSFISEESGSHEFLEIDLGSEHTVGGVITQGRFANGLGQEFAEFFLLQYWRPGMEDFKDYVNGAGVDLFTGNRDTYSEVETRLEPALIASRVRIVPFSYHPRTVCMRVELKGCKTLIADIPAPTPSVLVEEKNDETEKYEILIKEPVETEAEVELEHKVVVLEPWWETEYMGVAVGVLVTVILVLIVIIVFILYKNYKSSPFPSTSPYYGTSTPRFDHPESQWPERKLTLGRQLPPTPTTSEEQYTDSSGEYSSPLIATHARTQIYKQTKSSQPDVSWESFFPCPPPGTPPRLTAGHATANRSIYGQPVSHYAATDVINPSAKIYGKSGLTYFL